MNPSNIESQRRIPLKQDDASKITPLRGAIRLTVADGRGGYTVSGGGGPTRVRVGRPVVETVSSLWLTKYYIPAPSRGASKLI
jgi:hypothetical protein